MRLGQIVFGCLVALSFIAKSAIAFEVFDTSNSAFFPVKSCKYDSDKSGTPGPLTYVACTGSSQAIPVKSGICTNNNGDACQKPADSQVRGTLDPMQDRIRGAFDTDPPKPKASGEPAGK